MSRKASGSDDPKVDAALAGTLGMNDQEYEKIRKLLGRDPSYTELSITAALWSEHCASKSSNVLLGKFPSQGEHVLQGPGENAGVIDIGHDWVVVFKIESRNRASYIAPYEGSAAAVGGILRDIFTMGARPIAGLDSLRFGDVSAPRMRQMIADVVRGIGDYSNCVGIPTIGGEAGFHPCYDSSVVVNTFALGLARRDRMCHARATGPGNPLLYAGNRTGRDAIRSAAMEAQTRASEDDAPRPLVQRADPFTEKALLEACLEVMRGGAVVAMQDMGAAGLTSTAFEMASRGGTGFRLDLGKVPLRAKDLSPYEILLSESQERMLLVVDQRRQEEVARIFERWDLEIAPVGQVTDDGMATIFQGRKKLASLPIRPLVQGRPMYRRPVAVPEALAERQKPPEVPPPDDVTGALERLLDTPELGCKSWIWSQFDHTVRTNTVLGPGGDAAVLLLKGTPSGLAFTCDVNPVYCALDPHRGGSQAVAEAVRNLACVGAEPVGISDCLNFGNPEDPEVSWQFRECVHGMAAACRAFDVPVVSGDVSFYNGGDHPIHPTPTVAMVGIVPDLMNLPESHFTQAGDRILLLGSDAGEFGGSAYLRLLFDVEQGRPPEVDLRAEEGLADLLRVLAFEGTIHTAHDLAEGGLAVGLAEACFGCGLGAEVRVDLDPACLFSETQARAIVAAPAESAEQVLKEAQEFGVPAVELGTVGGTRLVVQADGATLEAEVEDLWSVWSTALPRALER